MAFLDEIGSKLLQLEKKAKVAAKEPEFTLIEAKIVKFCTEPRVSSSIIELFPARPHNILGIVQSLVKRGILLSCTNKYVANLEHRDFNVVMTMTAGKKADASKYPIGKQVEVNYGGDNIAFGKLVSVDEADGTAQVDFISGSDRVSLDRLIFTKAADTSSDIATTWENADDLQREDLLKAVNITSDYIRQYSAIDSFDLLPIWLQNALRYEKKASVLPMDETLWKNEIKDTVANLKADNITFKDAQEMTDYLVGDKGDLTVEQKEYAGQLYNESANVTAEKTAEDVGKIYSIFEVAENLAENGYGGALIDVEATNKEPDPYEREDVILNPYVDPNDYPDLEFTNWLGGTDTTGKYFIEKHSGQLEEKFYEQQRGKKGEKKVANYSSYKDEDGDTIFKIPIVAETIPELVVSGEMDEELWEFIYSELQSSQGVETLDGNIFWGSDIFDFSKASKQASENIDKSDIMITKTREGYLYEYRTPNDIVLKQHYIGYDDKEEMMSDFLAYIKDQDENSGEIWEQTASKQASAYTDFVGKYMKENAGSSIGDAAKAWSKQKGKSEDKTDDKSKDKAKEIKEDKSTKTKKDVVKEDKKDKEKVEKKADTSDIKVVDVDDAQDSTEEQATNFYEYPTYRIWNDKGDSLVANYQLIIDNGIKYIVTDDVPTINKKLQEGSLKLNWEQDAYNFDMREKKADNEVEDFEEEFNEPQPEDYVISDSRKGVSVGVVDGKFFGEFSDEDEAMIAIKEDMELSKFWPNVWYQDDHGGLSLRTASKKQANFPIEGYENYNGFYIDTNTYKVYAIDGTSPYFADSIKDAKDWIDKEGVKTAAGEADGDYDTEFFDEIVNQLSAAGFSATYREFDKYQGVYLNVRGVDTFWVDEVYSRGTKSKEDVVKPYIKAVLIDADGNTYSATRGDYFQLKDDYIFEDYTLALTKQNGEKVEIENPKKSDLPDLVEVGSTFTYEKGTMTEVYIFTPENDPEVGIEVTNKDGVVDASDLVDYCKSVSGIEASVKKAASGYDFSVVNINGFEYSVINILSPFGQVNYEEEGVEEGGSVLEIGVLGVPADKLIEFAKTVESLGASIWSVAIGNWGVFAENHDDLTPTEFVTQILNAKEASIKKADESFKTVKDYEKWIKNNSKLLDVVSIGNIVFTMDNYDEEGKEVSYGNKTNEKSFIVSTKNRYESFSDAKVSEIEDMVFYRTDINYEASIKKADDEKTITEIVNVPRKISPLEKTKDIPREEYIVAKEANDTLKDLYKSVMELSSQIAIDEEEIKRVAAEMKKTKEIDPSKALLQESIEKLTQMLAESDKIVTINAEKVLKLVEKSSEEPVLSETVLAKLEEMREKHRQIEEDYIKSAGAQMKEIKRTITQELKVIPLRADKVAISFKEILNKIKNFFTGWISDAKNFGKELDAITW